VERGIKPLTSKSFSIEASCALKTRTLRLGVLEWQKTEGKRRHNRITEKRKKCEARQITKTLIRENHWKRVVERKGKFGVFRQIEG